jgi:predicted Co/Zn/Cd cation transporter (cation efflux family)
MGGNFFIDIYQIAPLAVAIDGPPFIALCFSFSTLIAGLLDNGKNIKLASLPVLCAVSFLKRTVITS